MGAESSTDHAPTMRPAACRLTLRVPSAEPAPRARTTLEAVAHAALTRAFDAERSILAVRANAERLRSVPDADTTTGVADHWAWLASQNVRVAEALARVANAERELSDAARAVAGFLGDAEASLALIATAAPTVTASCERETLRSPPLSPDTEASEGAPCAEVG